MLSKTATVILSSNALEFDAIGYADVATLMSQGHVGVFLNSLSALNAEEL